MRSPLLVAVATIVACSGQALERGNGATQLPMGLPRPSIVRQAVGSIVGADKGPVAGALVAVIDQASYRGVGFSVSDQDGRFVVGLPSTPAVLSVAADGHVAGALPSSVGSQFSFVLARPSAATRRVSGTVVDVKGQPLARVRVRFMSWGWPLGVAYYASSDEGGRFRFLVDADDSYDVMVDDARYVSNYASLSDLSSGKASLVAYERSWIVSEASRADVSGLRELCTPFTGIGARRVAASLRSARVVGLGESTHGTREFTEVRRQLIEELVRSEWLTTIVLEASWEEASRLDDYVRRGKGTGRAAVSSLAYWPWRSEEFLELVESVRRLNDGLPPAKKIEFLGVDYAPPEVTVSFIHRFVESQGGANSDVLPAFEPLRRIVNWLERSRLSPEEREKLLSALEELQRRWNRRLDVPLSVTNGLHITKLILESEERDGDFRDRVMAEAVLSLHSSADKKRNVAVWAHSLHLAESSIEGAVPMGQYLKMKLGGEYRAIGSMFFRGSFRTYSGQQEKMINHAVVLPPPFYFESVMHRASPSSACVLDVAEAARRSSTRDWISVPKHVRIYGGLEISESYPWPPVSVPELWSALIFVPDTSPTTPLEPPVRPN